MAEVKKSTTKKSETKEPIKKTTTKKEAMIPYLMTCLYKAPIEFDAYLDQKLQYDYASGLFNKKNN